MRQQRWSAHAFDSSSDLSLDPGVEIGVDGCRLCGVADAQKSCTGLESGRQNETITHGIIWTGSYSKMTPAPLQCTEILLRPVALHRFATLVAS